MRCPLLRFLALLGVLLLCAPARAAPTLVSRTPLPDPHVLRVDGEWCVFGTGAKPFLLHGAALSPDQMRKEDLEIDYGDWPHRVEQIWGFTVYRHDDGVFHAYGTLHLGSFRTVVAHFAPAEGAKWAKGKPILRWRMTGLLLGDVVAKDWRSYESKVVREDDGTLHLVHCWHESPGRNVIRAQRMLAPDAIDRAYEPRTLLRPDGYRSEDRNEPGGLQLVEGASFVRVGGRWALLYSVGDYAQRTYKLGVAYSDRLIPPPGETYRKVLVADPGRVWGDEGRTDEIGYLLQSAHADWPNYCGATVAGPGLGSVVEIDGRPTLVFHGYRPDDEKRNPEDRFVWRVPLRIAVSDGPPTLDWMRPDL